MPFGFLRAALVLSALAATAGCHQAEKPLPQGIPKGAALLGEAVGSIGERDVSPEPPWEVEKDGMLYLRNASAGKVLSKPVKAGQTILLYPGWVAVAGARVDPATGRQLPMRYVKESVVARFNPGHRYELYYRPGMSKEELAKAKPATRPAGQHTLAPLDPVPVYRQRDAGSVERLGDDGLPIRPPAQQPEEPPPVLVPLPR